MKRLAVLATLAAGCVTRDPSGPPVPRLEGRYVSLITVRYRTQGPLETRWDTLGVTVWLPDASERGFFEGRYVTAHRDSGTVGGTLHADGTMDVTEFGQPPLVTLRGATFLHRLYPWCDFRTASTGTLLGRVSGDSLVIEGRASLFCRYQAWDEVLMIPTDLDVRLAGAR